MMAVMSATRRSTRGTRPTAAQTDAVLRASRAMVGIAATSIAQVDDVVTVAQLRVLVMVQTPAPLNLAAVATALEVNPSNASRTCDRLEKLGLLDRREAPHDRRNVTLTLTDAGAQLVDKVTKHRRAAIERVLRRMRPAEREQLAASLDEFATAAGEPVDDSVTLLWPPSR